VRTVYVTSRRRPAAIRRASNFRLMIAGGPEIMAAARLALRLVDAAA